jgi:hypothetical protein
MLVSAKAKFAENVLKAIFILLGVIVLVVVWYYAVGRKPKLVLTVPLSDKTESGTLRDVGQRELLHLDRAKATLYNLDDGQAKWSVALQPSSPSAPVLATPVPTPTPTPVPASLTISPAAAPARSKGDAQMDDLLVKRSLRRFDHLREWAAKLSLQRASLKTPLQIQSFNIEAGKYHAELADARAELAKLSKEAQQAVSMNSDPYVFGGSAEESLPAPASAQGGQFAFNGASHSNDYEEWLPYGATPQAIAEGGAILLVQGSRANLVDRGSGTVKKSLMLSGNSSCVFGGEGCAFVLSRLPDRSREVTRVGMADGSVQVLNIPGPPSQGRFQWAQASGVPAEPITQALRTEIRVGGGMLLQCDVRLIERKITERTLAGAPNSSLEEADRSTTGGFGNDALVLAYALRSDMERESTGGKVKSDESAYQITLNRPFNSGSPAVSFVARGHVDVFSSRSLDLVAADRKLYAFDHSGRKTWEANLGSPVADPGEDPSGQPEPNLGTCSQPFIEQGKRLYFFDASFLSAFDVQSGQPVWRVPIQEIHRLQLDGDSCLYASARAGETPLLMKVDASNGKILWKQEKYDECVVSEGQVYASREVVNAQDAADRVFQASKAVQCRWKLYKLGARDGLPQWEWFQTRRPQRILAQGKKVALLFSDELQVLKSIAF